MLRRAAPALLAGLLVGSAILAQQLPPGYPDRYPPPLPEREGPTPPKLAFEVVEEIAVAGPIDGVRLQLVEGRPAVCPPQACAPVVDAQGWLVSPSGHMRFRTVPDGAVEAQRRRRGGRRWAPEWRLRVGGATPAPPVLAGNRLFYGSVDNQVYGVRADNGHRLWAVDLGARVSRPLSLWQASVPFAASSGAAVVAPLELVLAVPDQGDRLLALDPYDGSRLAEFTAASGEGLVTHALVSPDGRIAIGRQGYRPEDAAIVVFRLGLPPPATAPATEAEGAGL